MKILKYSLIIASALVLGGCNLFVTEPEMETSFKLSTTEYEEEGRIPVKHAKQAIEGGMNTPIPFSWQDAPEGTKSFALTIIDPHEVANDWVHLMVINIPSNVSEVYTLTSSFDPSAGELINSYGEQGYGGPRPPQGTGEHPYVATIYALDTETLNLDGQLSKAEFLSEISNNVLDSTSYTGFFSQDW